MFLWGRISLQFQLHARKKLTAGIPESNTWCHSTLDSIAYSRRTVIPPWTLRARRKFIHSFIASETTPYSCVVQGCGSLRKRHIQRPHIPATTAAWYYRNGPLERMTQSHIPFRYSLLSLANTAVRPLVSVSFCFLDNDIPEQRLTPQHGRISLCVLIIQGRWSSPAGGRNVGGFDHTAFSVPVENPEKLEAWRSGPTWCSSKKGREIPQRITPLDFEPTAVTVAAQLSGLQFEYAPR